MLGRLRLYFRYSTRSLRRGGQRTVLGVFCIAVGVMAVVALRLAGDMISTSLITNVRQANGGDVSVVSTAIPLHAGDLGAFNRLQQSGVIQQYSALGLTQATARKAGRHQVQLFPLYILDNPSTYPLVGTAQFVKPAGATYASALSRPDSVVLTQFAAQQGGNLAPGDVVHLNLVEGGGVDAVIGGVVSNQFVAPGGGSLVGFVSGATYAALSSQPESYGVVGATTVDTQHANDAAAQLRTDFPQATVQTVQDALNANVQASQQVSEYLEIIGLLALGIGGIGIVHTLQVMLSRRRVEIAMLKTVGYRRRDLYALFGLETGLLGLMGGVLGTGAGIGMSLLVKTLIEQVIPLRLVFHVSGTALISGIAVGVGTSLVFGLLPIVRAAAIRPQAVLRDQAEGREIASRAQTVALYALIAALFIGLAASILGDFAFALQLVIYSIIGLLVLGGIFALILTIVGKIAVPERFSTLYVVTVTAAVGVAILITRALPGVGAVLLVAALCGYVVVLLPRAQRTVTKLALRSIARSRVRTSATLVALFVGVFTIGLILVLGQDISEELNNAFTNLANYNVFVIASPRDAATTIRVTHNLPGTQGNRTTEDIDVDPIAIKGTPFSKLIGAAPPTTPSNRERSIALFVLTGVEGYDLAAGSTPGVPADSGRALGPADAGTNNVMVLRALQFAPLNVKVGDNIEVAGRAAGHTARLHVVGFYAQASRAKGGSIRLNFFFQPILADRGVVDQLGSSNATTIVSLKLSPDQKLADLQTIENAAPNATVFDLADLGSLVQQYLGNLVDLLIGIASLALFAGVVIIANTVALAMLERRREIGILKATGYTSRSVLAQVLVENAVVGGIGGVTGMAMVSLATALLGGLALKSQLSVGTPIVLAVIAGVVLLTMAVAALVAWGPSRVRPLEVLRYE
jgi:putative ABC transport system permease protein